MIGFQLNFTRETGNFKTVVFVDDTGEVFEKFDAGEESGVYDYILFNDVGSTEGYREYIGALESAGNSLFGSNVWRKARPAINFFYQSQAGQRQIDVFEYLQDLFPHYYSFTFDVGGEISERVHYENNLLDATYNVGSQLIQTNAFNSGHPENVGYFCTGGACNCRIALNLAVDGSSANTLVAFPIFPKTVINRDGTITLGKAARVLRAEIGFTEDRRSSYKNVGFAIRLVGAQPDIFLSDRGIFSNIKGKVLTGDPYNDGGDISEPGGGTGTFDGSSDPVDFPALPTFSASDTGFVTLFNPSLQGLKSLAHFLWSDLIGASFEQTLNALKRVVSDPMDAILSLHVVPVPVPSSGSRNVGIYDIVSTVSLPLASTQYVILDCGTLNVKEFWGAYLDYSPYTKIEIYLPYIGIESLNIDDVMSKPVHVKYYIDLLTGGCVAFVKCGNSVLYQFSGSCALPIPFNSVNYTNTITGILSAAASIGGAIASGGLSAPLSAVGAAASVAQGAASAAQMASSSKPNVKKSGTMGGATGFLGIQKPYLILTRPRQAVAGFQNVYEGYPSHITSKLSDVHGFAQMEILVADGLSCSEPEKNEIVSLLESGVYLP
jgi:hypothetical protein